MYRGTSKKALFAQESSKLFGLFEAQCRGQRELSLKLKKYLVLDLAWLHWNKDVV